MPIEWTRKPANGITYLDMLRAEKQMENEGPCPDCHATWERDSDGGSLLQHTDDCQYNAARIEGDSITYG